MTRAITVLVLFLYVGLSDFNDRDCCFVTVTNDSRDSTREFAGARLRVPLLSSASRRSKLKKSDHCFLPANFVLLSKANISPVVSRCFSRNWYHNASPTAGHRLGQADLFEANS